MSGRKYSCYADFGLGKLEKIFKFNNFPVCFKFATLTAMRPKTTKIVITNHDNETCLEWDRKDGDVPSEKNINNACLHK